MDNATKYGMRFINEYLRHGQVATYNEADDTVTVTGIGTLSRKQHSITVPYHGLNEWSLGRELIQNCMPNVSREDREFLQSSNSPECWYKMFPDYQCDDCKYLYEQGESIRKCPKCGSANYSKLKYKHNLKKVK